MKSKNVIKNFLPVRVTIIGFYRSQREEVSRLGSVMGTLGFYPERKVWRDGEFQWYLWVDAGKIIFKKLCDMTHNDYYPTGLKGCKAKS